MYTYNAFTDKHRVHNRITTASGFDSNKSRT